MSGLILTVNLLGAIDGPKKHVDHQKLTVQLGPGDSVSRNVLHNNRRPQECTRVTTISSEVVFSWENGDCPIWESPGSWRKMTKAQRLYSYLGAFDEGYGFSFEFLES